jgi:hypothetical protein
MLFLFSFSLSSLVARYTDSRSARKQQNKTRTKKRVKDYS